MRRGPRVSRVILLQSRLHYTPIRNGAANTGVVTETTREAREHVTGLSRRTCGRVDHRRGRTGRAGAAADAAADRDQEGRRHRQRLHLPQRQPSVDVRRHQGWRDRHRSDRLRPADRRPGLCRRDQEDHRQADQIPDLQPPSLTTTSPAARRSRTPARRIIAHKRAKERLAPLKDPQHRAARRDRSTSKQDHQARRHHARAAAISASTIPTPRS